jgi:purine/pyrimidine-nucleoside phosphorylase
MSQFDNVAVFKKANVYFDGKCVSHTVQWPDGTKKSVGVILPATLTFNTGVAEIMETVSGACRYRIKGEDWQSCAAGQSFKVPGNSSFDIEVSGEPYHYVCHFA